MAVVVYGIVRSGHPALDPPPTGLGRPGGPVYLVRHGPLAAAVSVTDDLTALGEQDAARHLEILQQLLARGPVLPLRLGTVAPDDAAVRGEVLEPAAASLRERLDSLDGLVELHLDVDEEETSALSAVLPGTGLEHQAPPADLDERIRLGERIAQLIVARRVGQATEILDVLCPLARADRPRRHHGGPEDPVLSWAFLVATDELDGFDEAVRMVRRDHPELAIEYVGPLPAVDFATAPAETEIDSGWGDRTTPAGTPSVADAGPGASFEGTGRWGWGEPSGRERVRRAEGAGAEGLGTEGDEGRRTRLGAAGTIEKGSGAS